MRQRNQGEREGGERERRNTRGGRLGHTRGTDGARQWSHVGRQDSQGPRGSAYVALGPGALANGAEPPVAMRPGRHVVLRPSPRWRIREEWVRTSSPDKSRINKYKLVTGPESAWPGQDVHRRYPDPEELHLEEIKEEIRES